MPQFKQLIAGFSLQMPGSDQRSVHVGLAKDKVVLDHVFHTVIPSIIITPMHHFTDKSTVAGTTGQLWVTAVPRHSGLNPPSPETVYKIQSKFNIIHFLCNYGTYTIFIINMLYNVFIITYCSDISCIQRSTCQLAEDGQELWLKRVRAIFFLHFKLQMPN